MSGVGTMISDKQGDKIIGKGNNKKLPDLKMGHLDISNHGNNKNVTLSSDSEDPSAINNV